MALAAAVIDSGKAMAQLETLAELTRN